MGTRLPPGPHKVTVKSVQPRYGGKSRPSSWDDRQPGIDVVITTDGRTLRLMSDGQQSSPEPGWVLMVDGADHSDAYRWTLYGLPAKAPR